MNLVGESTFDIISLVNEALTWADDNIEPCMMELCDRYHIDFESCDDYETLWDRITHEVYADAVTIHQYVIDSCDYAIISLESDNYEEYAVIDRLSNCVMFDVYFQGSLEECKKYVKERIDND